MDCAPTTANLLIISDLHLGEGLKPTTTGILRRIVLLERELIAFFCHYTVHREDGRPWRLIINGDMVDFLSICLFPNENDEIPAKPGELIYGLGSRPPDAQRKIFSVLERHAQVFSALACFVGAGNEVVIVAGNHDVEFHWPGVREALRDGIANLWTESPAAHTPGARSRTDIGASISFHPWFYFEEGVVWAEHGHQYDNYCSQSFVSHPVGPDENNLMLTVAAAGMRYITNHMGSGDSAGQGNLTALQYIRWGLSQGARGLLRAARAYGRMVADMFSLNRELRRRVDVVGARRERHREKLRAQALRFRLTEATLHALDDLRHRPLVRNLAHLIQALMVDRLVLGAVALAAMVSVWSALPMPWAVGATVATLVSTYAANHALSRARLEVDPGENMKKVPDRIRSFVHAPFVVFGHTHDPVALKLDNGGMYFNTGTWLTAAGTEEGRAFTHVLIRHGEHGLTGALYRWSNGRSEAFG